MAQQFNLVPNFNVPLLIQGVTSKDWYFFFTGLFRGLAPSNVETVVLGTSPYTYTADSKGFLLVTGGTVSLIEFSRDGTTFYTMPTTSGQFTMNAADQLRITYTVAPVTVFVPT